MTIVERDANERPTKLKKNGVMYQAVYSEDGVFLEWKPIIEDKSKSDMTEDSRWGFLKYARENRIDETLPQKDRNDAE